MLVQKWSALWQPIVDNDDTLRKLTLKPELLSTNQMIQANYRHVLHIIVFIVNACLYPKEKNIRSSTILE